MPRVPRIEPEASTRRLRIDPQLNAVGWRVVSFDPGAALGAYKQHAIREYSTANGPADYALCVDGQIVGVIEAKRVAVGPEPGNVADPAALQVLGGEGTHLGFVPRYLCDDLRRLRTACGDDAQVSVRRVNPPPTPLQFRILCGIESCWPTGFRPFSSPDFEPLHELTSVVMAGSAGSRSTTG